jgi:hypothetical protein
MERVHWMEGLYVWCALDGRTVCVMCTGWKDCICDVHSMEGLCVWCALDESTVCVMCNGLNFRNRSSTAQKVTCAIKQVYQRPVVAICTACFKHTRTPHLAHTMHLYVLCDRQSRLIISLNSRKWFAVIHSRKWLVVLQRQCVICAVRTECLYIIRTFFMLNMAVPWLRWLFVCLSLGSSPGWSMYVCGMKSGTARGFSLSTSVCACRYHSLTLYTLLYITRSVNLANVHTKPFFFEILHWHCTEKNFDIASKAPTD